MLSHIVSLSCVQDAEIESNSCDAIASQVKEIKNVSKKSLAAVSNTLVYVEAEDEAGYKSVTDLSEMFTTCTVQVPVTRVILCVTVIVVDPKEMPVIRP